MRWNWPKLRATLISAALFFGLVDGIPPASQSALAILPPVFRRADEVLRTAQRAVLAPVTFFSDGFRVQQRWELFTGSRDERFRLWIEARTAEGEPWQLLYRPHDPEHALFATELEYRRVRAAWNPRKSGARAGYPAFVDWVSRRIFLHDARFESVRIRAEQIRLLPGGRGFSGTGIFVHTRERLRSEVLP